MIQSRKVLETVHKILGPFLIFTGTSHVRFQCSSFFTKVTEWSLIKPNMVVLLSGGTEILSVEGLLFLPKQWNNLGWLKLVTHSEKKTKLKNQFH